ncbi:hypothetical protein BJ166DRAFT_498157 [Pestalotiopsis sp. NC0098]|nr:hypothetical protein BJ166DRAFT_498157 [Pestalotiopsis sp. NC0098]
MKKASHSDKVDWCDLTDDGTRRGNYPGIVPPTRPRHSRRPRPRHSRRPRPRHPRRPRPCDLRRPCWHQEQRCFNQAPCDGGLDFSRSRQQIFDVFTIIRQVVSVGSAYSKGNNGRIADIVFECLRGTIGPDTWRSGWNLEDELGSKAQTGNGPRSLLPPTKRWLCSMMAFICEVMQGTQTTGAAIATTVEGILEGIRGQVIGI